MTDRYPNPIGLAELDDMIARAEALCERYSSAADEERPRKRFIFTRRRNAQHTMEQTLARLRAQRKAAGQPGQTRKGAP